MTAEVDSHGCSRVYARSVQGVGLTAPARPDWSAAAASGIVGASSVLSATEEARTVARGPVSIFTPRGGDIPRAICPRQESNLHPALRRRVLYPLSYEGWCPGNCRDACPRRLRRVRRSGANVHPRLRTSLAPG